MLPVAGKINLAVLIFPSGVKLFHGYSAVILLLTHQHPLNHSSHTLTKSSKIAILSLVLYLKNSTLKEMA